MAFNSGRPPRLSGSGIKLALSNALTSASRASRRRYRGSGLLGRGSQLKAKMEVPPSKYFWRGEVVIATTHVRLL